MCAYSHHDDDGVMIINSHPPPFSLSHTQQRFEGKKAMDCGDAAANEYCQLMYGTKSTGFQKQHKGHSTWLLGDETTNDAGDQDGFEYINCA